MSCDQENPSESSSSSENELKPSPNEIDYEKIDEKTVVIDGNIFKKRKLYDSSLYFSCATSRKNENNKVLYSQNL